MRARTFAREIAFQVLYREDLNPQDAGPVKIYTDPLLEQGEARRQLVEFVSHLAQLHDPEDSGPEHDPASFPQWLRTPAMIEFTRSLVAGVALNREQIDRRLADAAANWSIDRMAATDRNLLRLGAYEILFTDTPGKVAIDESIELAKRFGGAQSAQFVNGILDRVLHLKVEGLGIGD